ncbi:MAG TPA: sulfite exporter TauE/SafE family protein [Terriglobia bacterium]|nr:sulfite exporter TauE/SafE family protein [Terriglobia bacterium]
MHIVLPVAGLSIPLPVLLGAGMVVGFLSGMFGVGGGFLLTPILMMIGIPPTVAAASDSCQIVAASSSGSAAHFRLGNVDVKLGVILLLGGLAGATVGVQIIKALRAIGTADFVITVTYIFVLGGIGGYMFFESLANLRRGALVPDSHRVSKGPGLLGRAPFQIDFPRSQVRHSILVPFFMCGLVGVLAAIMGVGGGFIMVPMMVYILRMPMHVAVGTDLFQILFTSAGITFMQSNTNHTVDLVLALILAAGSTVGAQIGARVGRRLRGDQLKILLASIVLLVMIKMLIGLVQTPSVLLNAVKGH